MTSTTTSKTTDVLRDIFARNSIPRQLISDNGPQFISEEFPQFMIAKGVKYLHSSPYHPASNSAAERLIQTMKRTLRANHQEGMPIEKSLSSFLLRYRTMPHSTTGVTPSSLFVGRELCTHLHLLFPNVGP